MAAKNGTDENKALELALAQIERSHGKGSIQRFGEHVTAEGMLVVSSGCLSLDYALGVFGFPKGRIVEIYGPESSGKTTLALHAVAEAQKAGGVCAYIDAEHAMDPVYTKNLGVNLDQLLISQPDSSEQALDITETLVRSNAVDIIVIDSVAALVPRAEIDGEIGDTHVGVMARMMSQAMRKLTGVIHQSNCIVVFINQIREKIGVMFGSNETTPGGRALKFYSSVRLDVRRIGQIKDAGETIGNRIRVRVVKNKVAAPFRQAEFDMLFNEGISAEGDLVDLGVNYKIVEKSGAWFSYQGERLGQGRENTKRFLKDNPDIAGEIRQKIMEALGAAPLQEASGEPD